MTSVHHETLASGRSVGRSPTTYRDYSVYGISLRSEIPLSYRTSVPGAIPALTFSLRPARWFADVRASIPADDISNGWYDHAVLPDGSIFLRWPGRFEFVVSADGRAVACGLLENGTDEWFQTYLLGQVLSFSLVKQGYEPLHSTVVVVDGRGVAFLGDSGYGKSTLAASFLRHGHTLLTDDLLLLRLVDGKLCGYPGPSRIKLFPHIANSIQAHKMRGVRVRAREKLVLPLNGHEVHDGPVPIHGFFILDEPAVPTSAPSIETLPLSDSLVAVVAAAFNTRIRHASRLRRQFFAAQAWTALVPVRRITYPRTLAMLELVRDVVVSDVRSRAMADR